MANSIEELNRICHSSVKLTNGRSLESLYKGASLNLASTINYRIKKLNVKFN